MQAPQSLVLHLTDNDQDRDFRTPDSLIPADPNHGSLTPAVEKILTPTASPRPTYRGDPQIASGNDPDPDPSDLRVTMRLGDVTRFRHMLHVLIRSARSPCTRSRTLSSSSADGRPRFSSPDGDALCAPRWLARRTVPSLRLLGSSRSRVPT